jgi:hypothetical protein
MTRTPARVSGAYYQRDGQKFCCRARTLAQAKIRMQPTAQQIILDGLENLYVRTVHGLSPI